MKVLLFLILNPSFKMHFHLLHILNFFLYYHLHQMKFSDSFLIQYLKLIKKLDDFSIYHSLVKILDNKGFLLFIRLLFNGKLSIPLL